jgi:hypothetical protein
MGWDYGTAGFGLGLSMSQAGDCASYSTLRKRRIRIRIRIVRRVTWGISGVMRHGVSDELFFIVTIAPPFFGR